MTLSVQSKRFLERQKHTLASLWEASGGFTEAQFNGSSDKQEGLLHKQTKISELRRPDLRFLG